MPTVALVVLLVLYQHLQVPIHGCRIVLALRRAEQCLKVGCVRVVLLKRVVAGLVDDLRVYRLVGVVMVVGGMMVMMGRMVGMLIVQYLVVVGMVMSV